MVWHVERLTITVDEAAVLLGISRGSAYESIRTGEFPVDVIRIGSRILIPKQKFMDVLGGKNEQTTS